jgi:CxxC motif-containing protein (DUF1111 family)
MKAASLSRRALFFVFTIVLIGCGFCLLQSTHPATVHAQSSLGGPIPNLSPLESVLFHSGFQSFVKIWDPTQGLGPVFIQDSCAVCHASPAIGGNSTQKTTFFEAPNPNEGEIYLQTKGIGHFKTCIFVGEIIPPDATVVASHQPYQAFGSGLIDAIADSDIAAQAIDKGMGVHGIANIVPDENGKLRPGRFGSKSEFPDLITAVANEMVHEIGITNPIIPEEDLPQGKPIPPRCAQPGDSGATLIGLYHYLTYLAPNLPGTGNTNGQLLFSEIGCDLCHLPSYKTAARVIIPVLFKGATIESKALENQPVNLYSDLILHDMGGSDSDGLELGLATGTMFRTAPLWGLSSRLADGDGLLHDGSAKDIPTALARHGGEASQVIGNFDALSSSDQADLIAFISSL